MKRFYTLATFLLLVSSLAPSTGCAARPAAPHGIVAPRTDAIDALRADLVRIFDDRNFSNAEWGVEVVSLDNGQTLFERNAGRLFMPASNNKVLTGAAALVRLGADYRFRTRIMTSGAISGGTLQGDLVVVGAGDPSNAPRFHGGDPFGVFKEWAAILKQKGVTRIEGNIVGDDGAFADPPLGRGWAWDDLAYGYAAAVTALQFNENLVTLEVSPGPSPGSPAGVSVKPVTAFLHVDASVTTAATGTASGLDFLPKGNEGLSVSGAIAAGAQPVSQTIAIRSPAALYVTALKDTLQQEGITVAGTAEVVRHSESPKLRLLWTHDSPPLSEILKPLLKVSQNLYAETLVRALGLDAFGKGSFERGREVVALVLGKMGIERGTYSYEDGSGLSRLNMVSPDLMVRIFRYMARQPCFPQFYDALPIAGVDGTIAGRMKGTRAENNVRAKTGTLEHVRSLSGYVRTADGESLAFSIIANNFLVSSAAAEYVQDAAMQRLASFTRK